ncbi:TauD/TfdA family dioxygenase [Chryseobacterium sp. CT-SW4]|uniref:TauD/TfdA family dioxygenase n=1 Tax=Chryseobacterium sp. SW-1 TaxID=3157343 RepID=UPI003B02067C
MKIFNLLKDTDEIKSEFQTTGKIFFKCDKMDIDQFCNISKEFGEIEQQDFQNEKVTIITTKDCCGDFNDNNELFPHTDRSTLENPPNILIYYYRSPSDVGGETWLIDTKKILLEILLKYGEDCKILQQAYAVFSDQSETYIGNIFEKLKDGSYCVRFRNDKFEYLNRDLIEFLPLFYDRIEKYKETVKLEKGYGYMIHNGRFLHGRAGFTGKREAWRLLLHDNFMDHKGFLLSHHIIGLWCQKVLTQLNVPA